MATQVSLNSGAVASAGALALQTNGTTQAVSISTGQVATLAQNPILTSGTINGVAYLNGSNALTTGSALVFDGSKLDVLRSSTTTNAFDESEIRAINTGAATTNQRVDVAMRFQDGTYNGTGGISMIRESATARSGALSLSAIDSSGNPTNGIRLNSTGAVALLGASTSANGVGITFPATQSASSNANTLDDYEEGSWTYDFTATTGTITKSATYLYGYYTKVGRVVTITGFLQVTSVSSPTGVLTLTGLPFPITSTGSREGFVGGGIYGSSLAVGSVSPLMVSGSAGSSSLTISKFVTGSSANLAGDVVADTRFQISFTYFTD